LKSLSRAFALEGNIRVLAAQALISQIGFGMFYVIWQPYLLSTGISIGQLGVIQTMINVSTGLGLLAWGYIGDSYGRRPVVIASNACRVVAMAVLIVSRHYAALLAFAFFIGFTAMFMMGNPGRSALITESVDSAQRATAYSTLLAVSQGTSTLMASAGGYIAVKAGYTPILYATLAFDVIGLTLLYLYVKETHTPVAETKDAASIWVRIRDALLPEGENVVLYLLMLTMGFGYAVAYSLFYGALTDYQGFTPLELGFMRQGGPEEDAHGQRDNGVRNRRRIHTLQVGLGIRPLQRRKRHRHMLLDAELDEPHYRDRSTGAAELRAGEARRLREGGRCSRALAGGAAAGEVRLHGPTLRSARDPVNRPVLRYQDQRPMNSASCRWIILQCRSPSMTIQGPLAARDRALPLTCRSFSRDSNISLLLRPASMRL